VAVNCPACGHENPPDSRFCFECGAGTAVRCAQCEAELPAGVRFCNQCGAPTASGGQETPERDPRSYTPKHLADKILQSKSALEGERKQVTVLFADIKGSMELQEGLDPEEWHRIMDRFFQILTEGVHRFEGTVNQYTGDGIMALFGAPISHEDHAQRACYAALHMRDELRRHADELRVERGLSFSFRMGLNSGEVVVGKIGDDLRMDYTAQGHTVGLAARMEQIAAPDGIYLTEHTAGLVTGYLEVRDLGTSRIKGLSSPIRIHELQGLGQVSTRLDVSRARGFSKFVGRTNEMSVLESGLQKALDGQGQVVGIVGEAGVGKSRICAALPFFPMLQLFRAFFGIRDQDSDAAAREKIAGRLLLLDERFREVLPILFDFLGVPDPEGPAPMLEPEARERQLVGVMKRVVEARSQRDTTVSVLEDLHWFDEGSDSFLAHFVEALAGSRSLMVLNFRPEYQAPWMRKSFYQQLPLVPLGPEAIGELLGYLLGRDPSTASLVDLVRNRTGGNPFFVEEAVRSLAESGHLEGTRGAYRLVRPVEELAVPDTVHAVLAARIDRLPEREKHVLQSAAVIGERIAESILKRVVELPDTERAAALSALQDAEFIYEVVLYPEAEYAFKHPLTRAVAYEAQLGGRRARIHGAVAQAIEAIHEDRLDEKAALIAHHQEQAGELLQAAHWHKRAALWAGMGNAAENLRHWRKVRKLASAVPESQETIDLRLDALGQILTVAVRLAIEEDVEALLDEGRGLAERSENPASRVHLLRSVGTYHVFNGEVAKSLEPFEEARRLADALGDPELRVGARAFGEIALWMSGQLGEALRWADESLELLEGNPNLAAEVVGLPPSVPRLAFKGMYLAMAGRISESDGYTTRALAVAREKEDLAAMVVSGFAAAWKYDLMGEKGESLAHSRRAVEVAERLSTASFLGAAYGSLGRALIAHGLWEEATEAFDQSIERGTGLNDVLGRAWRPLALLGCGDSAAAREAGDRGVTTTQRAGAKNVEIDARLVRAVVLLRTAGLPDRARVESDLARAEELIDESGCEIRRPSVHEIRAELARLAGDDAVHDRELREAHRLFAEMGAPAHAERVARELA
jgi:class 3 adenylate cyclase/tetratricopeptide (TPR) repeat protein